MNAIPIGSHHTRLLFEAGFNNHKRTIMKKTIRHLPWVMLALLGADAANAETYIRKNAATPAAQADLEALKTAMKQMRNTPCDNPASWYYQGGIHWTPDPSTLPKNPFCASFDAQHQNLKTAWNTCASHDAKDISEIHFLAWHRLYLYHLEKIVRKVSGKKDFALPYWNYVSLNSGGASDLTMPRLFWSPADPDSNALYTKSRLASLNEGQPIDIKTNVNNQRDAVKIRTSYDYKTFNSALNHSIHDNMHVYIGGPAPIWNEIEQTMTVGLMGDIPSAAFDPIFWMHHGNVDRLFQQWTDSRYGKKITLADLTSVSWPYIFFDENGKEVSYTAQQVYDILYNLDYRYDDQAAVEPELMAPKAVQPKETKIVSQAVNKAVSAAGAQFTLPVPKAAIPVQPLTAELKAPAKSIVLEVEVSYDQVPQGRYEVHVNLPAGDAEAADKDKHYLGAMHFFAAHVHPGQKGRRVFRYDLTDELSDSTVLGRGPKEGIAISVLGAEGATSAGFTIDKATVYTYDINP